MPRLQRAAVAALAAGALLLAPSAPAAAQPGGAEPPAPLETQLDSAPLPDADDPNALELEAQALELAIRRAWDEVRRLERGVRFLKRRYVQKMQVSWSACGGRRAPSDPRPLAPAPLGPGWERVGAYRVPRGGPARPGELERYAAFRMNSAGEIVEQFKSVGWLPEEVASKLDSAAAGFRYEAPNGDVYARYFDFLVVTPGLRVVAAYRTGGRRPDGVVPLVVFPREARDDPRAAYRSFALHGPRFPAVITRLPVSRSGYERYRARFAALAGKGFSPGLWPESDPERGSYVVWAEDVDAVRCLAGTRHVLVPGGRGPVYHDSYSPAGRRVVREWLTPREDLLVVQGTETSFADRALPGIPELDERVEELYRRGGVMYAEPAAWKALASMDRVAPQDRPLKIEVGGEAVAPLEELRQRRLRRLQQQLERETDAPTRVRLDRELSAVRDEYWWRDEQDFLFVIYPSPEEEARRLRQGRLDLARLCVEYGAARVRLFLMKRSWW
jgi:hypothetical protein